MKQLITGKALTPIAEDAMLRETHLILYANEDLDVVVVIPTSPRRSGKTEKHQRIYFSGYKKFRYAEIASELDLTAPKLTQTDFVGRDATLMTTEDLEKRFKRRGQELSNPTIKLNYRWSRIKPIVMGNEPEVLFDREQMRSLVRARAKEIEEAPRPPAEGSSKSKVVPYQELSDEAKLKRLAFIEAGLQESLNQYWAGGSFEGALIGFTGQCGAAGQRRQAGELKRGAPNAYSNAGQVGQEGINVTADSDHAKTIKFCYDNYLVRGVTVAEALRKMWWNFYSIAVQQPDGTMKLEWLPEGQRPTRSHFDYWGTLETPEKAAWRKHLPPEKFEKSFRAIRGSAHDNVFAIGQRGYMDSTTTDLHLVRATNRLARIGLANRILIADAMFGYIPGLYMGTDPADSMTVRLAAYHASDPNMREWLDDLGLEDIPAEDFIPMTFANLVGDNTDLRSQEVMDCLHPIGTNISYVPKSRSDWNPLAEAGHHKLHRMVDHNLSGTTHGQVRKERGETLPVDLARHTLKDAMRESARAIWTHNTMELNIERSVAMKIGNCPPTRIAMTRDLMKRKVHRSNRSDAVRRLHLLPRMDGTFTPWGVRIHRPNTGDKVSFLEPVVWTSDHPLILQWQAEARRGGKRDPNFFRARFIVKPYCIRRIWYVNTSTGEQIELGWRTLDVRDPELPYVATLYDLEDMMQGEAAEKKAFAEARQQKLGNMEAHQEAAKANAEAEYQRAVANAEGPLPKSRTRADRRNNRDKEDESHLFGMPITTPPPLPPAPAPAVALSDVPNSALSQSSPPKGPPSNDPSVAAPIPKNSVATPPAARTGQSLLRMAVNNTVKKTA